MSMIINRLMSEKEQAARDTLDRLRYKAPTVWQNLQDEIRRRGLSGLGYSWSDFLDTAVTVKAAKEISEDERKAAEIELTALREKNAAIERQIRLQKDLEETKNKGLTLAQKSGMLGDSILGQFMDKPYALPALIGLGFAWWRSRSGSRRSR